MCSNISGNTELADVAHLFYGDSLPKIAVECKDRIFCVTIDGKKYSVDCSGKLYDIIPKPHFLTRLSKIALYIALNRHTGLKMPWGALTGVRPTKLFYECLAENMSVEQAKSAMQNIYRVSAERADILAQIVISQRNKLHYSAECYNLYVHVPYCTTRCSYCSFVSLPITKHKNQSTEYVKLLCDEIKKSTTFLSAHGKRLLSVYIGGGTPTALSDEDFEMLLSAIDGYGCEYTCEAGRPDTITDVKLDIMKAHGVTRVCVNPQTLNENTLEKIGRRHSSDDFFLAYERAKVYGFEINCDLIAGLENESVKDFAASFDGVKALLPQNITVHSLSRKNGSSIRYINRENSETAQMLDYIFGDLAEYSPYYLYRQKRQSCNLENVGLSLAGKECVNNITTMEETVSVMACGAGAISKVIKAGNISRFANMRDVGLYISRYDERLAAKLDYFSSAFI